MNRRVARSESLLLLASAIWGFAFVAQRLGMEHVGPFTFNGVRFALGALSLTPLLFLAGRGSAPPERDPGPRRSLLYGVLAGTVLYCGASLQQVGIVYTTAGKAAFITGLYVVLVPILGLALGHRPGRFVWTGALTAAGGMYFLSVTDRLTISLGDGLVLIGAVFWASHVLLIGWLTNRMAAIRIAVLQFATCSILSMATAAAFETITLEGLRGAAIPILYGGLMSVGIAYTLQIVAQRNVPPAHAAIILSLETVFGAVGGWWILGETMSPRGILGCALMLVGVILAQLSPSTSPLGDPVTAEEPFPDDGPIR